MCRCGGAGSCEEARPLAPGSRSTPLATHPTLTPPTHLCRTLSQFALQPYTGPLNYGSIAGWLTLASMQLG